MPAFPEIHFTAPRGFKWRTVRGKREFLLNLDRAWGGYVFKDPDFPTISQKAAEVNRTTVEGAHIEMLEALRRFHKSYRRDAESMQRQEINEALKRGPAYLNYTLATLPDEISSRLYRSLSARTRLQLKNSRTLTEDEARGFLEGTFQKVTDE